MMSFRTFIQEAHATLPLDQTPVETPPPALLTMTRESIRTFPNQTYVALYFAKSIKKYFAVVYHTN